MAQIDLTELGEYTNLLLVNDRISAKYWERKILGLCNEGLIVSKRRDSKLLQDYFVVADLIPWEKVKAVSIGKKYALWQFLAALIGLGVIVWGVIIYFTKNKSFTPEQIQIALAVSLFSIVYVLAVRRINIIIGTYRGLYDYYSSPFDKNIKLFIKSLLKYCVENNIKIKSKLHKEKSEPNKS